MNRTCTKCGVEKPLEEFGAKAAANTRRSWCRGCRNAWKAARSPEVKRAERNAWKTRNRHKHRVHRAVKKAVDRGTLVRPETCERCGAHGPIQAHHADYERRFDVAWLCVSCHAAEHTRAA